MAAFAEQARVRAALARLSIPTLVFHGEADRAGAAVGERAARGTAGRDAANLPAPPPRVHNEPEGPEVVADVVAWLRSVLESTHN